MGKNGRNLLIKNKLKNVKKIRQPFSKKKKIIISLLSGGLVLAGLGIAGGVILSQKMAKLSQEQFAFDQVLTFSNQRHDGQGTYDEGYDADKSIQNSFVQNINKISGNNSLSSSEEKSMNIDNVLTDFFNGPFNNFKDFYSKLDDVVLQINQNPDLLKNDHMKRFADNVIPDMKHLIVEWNMDLNGGTFNKDGIWKFPSIDLSTVADLPALKNFQENLSNIITNDFYTIMSNDMQQGKLFNKSTKIGLKNGQDMLLDELYYHMFINLGNALFRTADFSSADIINKYANDDGYSFPKVSRFPGDEESDVALEGYKILLNYQGLPLPVQNLGIDLFQNFSMVTNLLDGVITVMNNKSDHILKDILGNHSDDMRIINEGRDFIKTWKDNLFPSSQTPNAYVGNFINNFKLNTGNAFGEEMKNKYIKTTAGGSYISGLMESNIKPGQVWTTTGDKTLEDVFLSTMDVFGFKCLQGGTSMTFDRNYLFKEDGGTIELQSSIENKSASDYWLKNIFRNIFIVTN